MTPRERLLATKPKHTPIEIDGAKYTIRQISAREREYLMGVTQKANESEDYTLYRERLTAVFLGDEQGARLFDDTDEDAKKISELPAPLLDPVFFAGLRQNGLSKEALEDAKKDSPSILN